MNNKQFSRLAALTGALFATLSAGAARAADDIVPGEALFRVMPGQSASAIAQTYGLRLRQQLSGTPTWQARITTGEDPETLCERMEMDPRIEWAQPNQREMAPEINGPRKTWTAIFDGGTDPKPYENQRSLPQVNFKNAPTLSTGAGVTVAVLDTGISTRQPYVADKLVAGYNAFTGGTDTNDVPNRIDDNGNGVVDEGAGHGTMVAGVIARMAPQARLMPVKVLNSDGTGDLWTLVKGIRWAVNRGAKVLNVSLGVYQGGSLIHDVIGEAYTRGAIIVTSAGNNHTDRPQFPAGVSKVIAVAAVNPYNKKTNFSNYGSHVDVVAPGAYIRSTWWDGTFATWSGTSFAAPFVTGQAALIWSRYPTATNEAVQDAIEDTARSVDSLNPDFDGELGEGIIDVDRSLQRPPVAD
jgi:subtilisin family serine protease